jgi:hypothetical protein
MAQPVPAIYCRLPSGARLGVGGRALALLVGLAGLAPLVAGAWLEPAPQGFGTHTQLGMAACQFQRRSGLPCPTCGVTTSLAHFVRGHWLASVWCQPLGWVLSLAAAGMAVGGMYEAVTGRPVHRLGAVVPVEYPLWGLLILAMLAWAWKMLLVIWR